MPVISLTHGPYVPKDPHPTGVHCLHAFPGEAGFAQCCYCGRQDVVQAFVADGAEPLPVAPLPAYKPVGGIVDPVEG